MQQIDLTLLEIEAFLNCNPDGEDGFRYMRTNLRTMYLETMKSKAFESEREQLGIIAESFLQLYDLLEKLQTVSAAEVEELRTLIASHKTLTA
jgi:hypothetical protein